MANWFANLDPTLLRVLGMTMTLGIGIGLRGVFQLVQDKITLSNDRETGAHKASPEQTALEEANQALQRVEAVNAVVDRNRYLRDQRAWGLNEFAGNLEKEYNTAKANLDQAKSTHIPKLKEANDLMAERPTPERVRAPEFRGENTVTIQGQLHPGSSAGSAPRPRTADREPLTDPNITPPTQRGRANPGP